MWVCRISFRVSVYPEITSFFNFFKCFFFFCCLFCILDTVPDLSSKFLITALVLTSVWVGCFHLFSCKLQNCRNCSNFLHYPEQYTHQKYKMYSCLPRTWDNQHSSCEASHVFCLVKYPYSFSFYSWAM